ncbi:MAG: DUF1840 domain-containing protein [Burkholderiaceae bacterium]|nr:DUF1840 domain-containing protein [Burkholderiaceae bacterium]
MLYKFKSKAAGDLIMLEPNGRKVLEIIGKDAGATGILLPSEMPAAIAALDAVMAGSEGGQAADEDEDDVSRAQRVSLRQRVLPFLEMLKRCAAADMEIVWGV